MEELSSSKCNITSFIEDHADTIIISDTEGLNPTSQINKIISHLQNPSKGVIFNGDVLDYTITFGTEANAKTIIKPENLCALKLLKVFVDGMSQPNPNVVCNIGNRDLNKIKLLPLLLTSDKTEWWQNGNSYAEIAENLLTKFNGSSCKANFWLFNDLKTINPFWNVNNSAFKPRWNSLQEITTTTLVDRFNYIFGADPSMGTISAQNNLDFMHAELGIITEDLELKAAIVFTMYARMLFNKYTQNRTDGFIYDGILNMYLRSANAASYAVIQDTLLLFGHGGFTLDFFMKQSAEKSTIDMLDEMIRAKQEAFNSIQNLSYKEPPPPTSIPTPTPTQKGGSLNQELSKIIKFNENLNAIIESLLNYETWEKLKETNFTRWIRDRDLNNKKYFSNELLILTILSTPASNHPIFKGSEYDTKLSPIQVSAPVNADFAGLDLTDNDGLQKISRVYNIFSHIPNGFGYTFGEKKNEESSSLDAYNGTYFINTDFSNSLFKDTNLLDEYNFNYLFLHLIKIDNNYTFKLKGTIHLKTDGKNNKSSYNTIKPDEKTVDRKYLRGENESVLEYLKKLNEISDDDKKKLLFEINYINYLTNGELNLDEGLNFNFELDLVNPKLPTLFKNLNFHGKIIDNTDNMYFIYSMTILKNFKKILLIIPANELVENTNATLSKVSGGMRKISRKGINKKHLTKKLQSKPKPKSKSTRNNKSKRKHTKL
jgi:hypothetical protein